MNINEELIDKLLNQVKELHNKRQALVDELRRCDEMSAVTLYEYRVESVCRVLDFILSEYRDGRLISSLDRILVHCLNKLHGNIDGVELDLKQYSGREYMTLPLTVTSEGDQHGQDD